MHAQAIFLTSWYNWRVVPDELTVRPTSQLRQPNGTVAELAATGSAVAAGGVDERRHDVSEANLTVTYYALVMHDGRQGGLFRVVDRREPSWYVSEFVNELGEWVAEDDLFKYLFFGESGAELISAIEAAAWYHEMFRQRMPEPVMGDA